MHHHEPCLRPIRNSFAKAREAGLLSRCHYITGHQLCVERGGRAEEVGVAKEKERQNVKENQSYWQDQRSHPLTPTFSSHDWFAPSDRMKARTC